MASKFTAQQIDVFRKVFSLFDKSGDGTISRKELGKAIRKTGQRLSDKELKGEAAQQWMSDI